MGSIVVAVFLCGVAQVDSFAVPGYDDMLVTGVWYVGGPASSAMPLGALGTGFVDLTSAATFGDSTAENNWLDPRPVPAKCGLTVRVGDQYVELLPGADAPPALRFWGHYPAADVDFGDTFGEITVFMRAFAPLIPHDYELSSLPVAFFHFTATNAGSYGKALEIGLQWQALSEVGAEEAQGNVEGALGWQRGALAPGTTWTVAPCVVFARDLEELGARVRELQTPVTVLAGEDVREGKAYASDDEVSDFLVDALGGFDSETYERHSASFDSKPMIGQMFWRLNYGNHEAGRGPDGPHGLKEKAFPARTADGALSVNLRVFDGGAGAFTLAYDISNISNKEVHDLAFVFSLNADLGGPKYAEKQHAELDRDMGALVFQDDRVSGVVGLTGGADRCLVTTWPKAYATPFGDEWALSNKAPETLAVKTIHDGVQIKTDKGSYAVAVLAEDEGWSLKSVRTEHDVIRAQAVRTLDAGTTADVVLALAWHFPTWKSSDGETLRHRYAVAHPDAGSVLDAMIPRAGEIEKKIAAWQRSVYTSLTPAFLKDAVINGLYIWPRNSWWLDDARFFQNESFTGCPITESFVCRFNGSFPLALMFPECERATMRSIANAQAESGEIPFTFGSPTGSRSPYFHVQHPIVSPQFVLVTWRNFFLWQDTAYLDEMYPHVQAALRYSMTLDKDGDGVIDEDPGSETGFPANQYYDVWPWWGTSVYTGSIWLAALRAGEEMAKRKGDAAFAQELRGWYDKALASFYDKLWTGAYYRLYNDPARERASQTSLTNALCGQWFAYTCGLGEIVPKATILAMIDAVLQWNVGATEYGAVNGVRPDGLPDETFPDHSAVITIGEVWNFCAMAAFAGKKDEAIRLFVKSYGNILAKQRTPWNIPWSFDRKTGAIKWGVNHYSNACIWTLFQALDPEAYAKLAKPAAD